jgi:uncharacterized membrane protein
MMVIFLRGTRFQFPPGKKLTVVIFIFLYMYNANHIKIDTWQKCIYFSTLVIALYVPF